MRCWKDQENEAVGVCAYCGRAVCRECAIELPSGRIVCSSACIERVNDRCARFKVWILYGMAFLFAATCLASLLMDYYGLAALMGIASVVTIMAAAYGTGGDSADRSFGELYWRAGMALLDAQRFRKNLQTFIPLYSRLTGGSMTLADLDSLDLKSRGRKLLDMVATSCRAIGKQPPPNPPTLRDDPFIAESLGYYDEVTSDFLLKPEGVLDSQRQRTKAARLAVRMEWRLSSTNCYLDALNRDIERYLGEREK